MHTYIYPYIKKPWKDIHQNESTGVGGGKMERVVNYR